MTFDHVIYGPRPNDGAHLIHIVDAVNRVAAETPHAAFNEAPRRAPPPQQTPLAFLLEVMRARDPINEFTQNNMLIYGGFGHLFPLAQGLSGSGPIPPPLITHMLEQHTLAFAKDQRFVLLVFNQLLRHEAARDVCAKVKSNPDTVAALLDFVRQPGFQQIRTAALADPEGPAGQQMVDAMMPFLRLTGGTVPFSHQAIRA
jgi:hypothetical protein